MRTKVGLCAAQGAAQRPDRRAAGTRRDVVSEWRKRSYEQRLAGLEERPGAGRSPVFPPEVVVVKALAGTGGGYGPGRPDALGHRPGGRQRHLQPRRGRGLF